MTKTQPNSSRTPVPPGLLCKWRLNLPAASGRSLGASLTPYPRISEHQISPSEWPSSLLLQLFTSQPLPALTWAAATGPHSTSASGLALSQFSTQHSGSFQTSQTRPVLGSCPIKYISSLPLPMRPRPPTPPISQGPRPHPGPSASLNRLLLFLYSRHLPASGPSHMLFLLQEAHFLQTSTYLNPSPFLN